MMIRTELADGVCVLRLDAPPLNMLTFQLLEALTDALRRAVADTTVRGIVITGGPDHFSAGADVSLFDKIETAEDAVRTSQVFQRAFQGIEDLPKPVVAALAGTIVGGALELAMACHLRVAAEGCRFRMPEVNLGINPGAGGTQRLPRLVGSEAALQMLLTAETVTAQRALQLGLVDALCRNDQLVEQAAHLIDQNPRPAKTSLRMDKIQDVAVRDDAFRTAEQLVARARPEMIAPRKILDAVRVGIEQSAQAGMVCEQQAFAQCMDTLAVRNKIYLFFATSRTSKIPELADAQPMHVRRAAVIGMGTMGTGIAQTLIQAGVPVVALDQNESAVQRGRARIESSLSKRVKQGKLPPQRAVEILQLLRVTSSWDDIKDADVVIESVFEDIETKKTALRRAEEMCSDDVIVATNTSTISLDRLVEGMKCPHHLVGMHFFNPAQRMPLVEIIRRESTPPEVLATVTKLAKRLRKTPVVVKNREGFLVNRVFVPYLQEAFYLLQEGASASAIDAAAVQFGFPMGPLVLIDMAGLDILVHAQRILDHALPHHGPLSSVATRLVEDGHLGQKTGSGVYRYESGDHTPLDNEVTAQIVADVQDQNGCEPREIGHSEITERLVLRMANEAFCIMREGVARCESDVDVAMVLGTGFPDFRGGILKYVEDIGLDHVLARLEDLSEQFGERFSPKRC